MGSSGGGSSSGAISYPLYMTQYHEMWLQQLSWLMDNITKNGNNLNPFYGVSCFEPTPFLTELGTQATKDLIRINTFYPGTVFGTVYNATKARLETYKPYTEAVEGIDALDVEIAPLNALTSWNSAYEKSATEISEDPDYNAILDALTYYKNVLEAFDPDATWTSNAAVVKAGIDTIYADENYNDDALAYARTLEDNIVNNVLPKFKAGMRDVNAAMGSAFVVGEGIIWGMMDRDVAKYLAGLKEKNIGYKYELFKSGLDQLVKMHEIELGACGTQVVNDLALFTKKWELNAINIAEILKFINSKIEHLKNKTLVANQLFGAYSETMDRNNAEIVENEFKYLREYRASVNLLTDIYKIMMVAYKEKITEQAALRESEWLWNIKLYQYAGNLLASIGSGVAINPPSEVNRTKTALGSMVSGAGIGGMIGAGTAVGGPVGAGIGAVLGLGLSLL